MIFSCMACGETKAGTANYWLWSVDSTNNGVPVCQECLDDMDRHQIPDVQTMAEINGGRGKEEEG